MSHYLVELYSPNAAWKALPAQERHRFLDAIRAGMAPLSGLGVELLALGDTLPEVAQASPHRFLGIWRFPDAEARAALLAGIQALGWYGYFDHVNAATADGDMAQHLAALATA